MSIRYLMLVALAVAAPASAAPEGSLGVHELSRRLDPGQPPLLILDTRTPEEFAAGHIPGARLVPHDRIEESLASLLPHRDAEIVLYCQSGRRAGLAEAALRERGFTHLHLLDGSWQAWQEADLPAAKVSTPGEVAQ